ncbi:PREDICTED: mitogen-activated kinase [Prunus dulcis]|uniref:PREDICTED: mitogen-activated kinase n=1 Tax=Prunus dulcis TaxID=3755 RepID=A0A5E4FKV6_PRUDU|nr:PREDICTED: mitogen-activated kinase [Prunus dulcis]
MKRKVDEKLDEEKHSMCSHGVHWSRGKLIGKGSYGFVFLATPRKPTKDEHSRGMLNLREMMAVKSAKVSASESIKHESDVLLEIKGCPVIIERLGEETTATDKGDMVYNLYTRSILEGIQHIHKYDYVHCDLKPDNILLVPTTTTSSGGTSFVAKIADFGLAKKTKVNYSRWRGTPRYLSPEAFINNKQDQSSDIWSLGCIVFEMLTGKSPWDLKPGYNPNNLPDVLMFDHLRTCKLPTGISDMARDFLKSCLAMNSRERLTAESLLSHPFVAQPQSSKEGHTKVKLINSFLGYASGVCCFKPSSDYHANSAIVQ